MANEQEFVQDAFRLLDETIQERNEVMDSLVENGHIDIAGAIAVRSTGNAFSLLEMVYKHRVSENKDEIILNEKDFRALHLYSYHLDTVLFEIANVKKALRDLLQSVSPVKEEQKTDPLAVGLERL